MRVVSFIQAAGETQERMSMRKWMTSIALLAVLALAGAV
jgi:hypothetical protein